MAKKNIRSYSELSRLTGISYRTVYKFGNGKSQRFDAETMERLCKVLECELKDLIYFDKKGVI